MLLIKLSKMKIPSDELFLLIKSLSRPEKIQFKLYAVRKKTDTNYIKLFNAIDKQKIYNEALLKRKFEKERFTHSLNRIKSYITNAILNCLEEYYSSESAAAELRSYINRIEILVNKRLYYSAKKIAIKAEKLAEEHEQYGYLHLILSLKNRIMVAQENLEDMNNYLHGDYLKEVKCAAIIKNLIGYNKLYTQAASIAKTKPQQITAQQHKTLKTLLKNPLLHDEGKALFLPEKLIRHYILGRVYMLMEDWKKSYLNLKKAIQLMEHHPAYLKTEIETYMQCIVLFMISMSRLRKDKELTSVYNKVKQVVDSLPPKMHSNRIFQKHIAMQINHIDYLLKSFDFHAAVKISEELKASIKKHGSSENFFVFQANLSLTYFYLGDYHKALHEINKILNVKESGMRQDIINLFKVLNIMVQYELGNEEMLPYLCRATQRYFEKKGELPLSLKLILKFFGKTILKTSTKQEKTDAFIAFKKELDSLMTENLFIDFDFISWLQSKIENRPFADIVREKAKKTIS